MRMAAKMKQNRPDLSIVIPALSEERRIGKTLDLLATYLREDPAMKQLQVEVVVVSADSNDRTHEIVAQKAAKFADFVFLKPGRRQGKGRDVQYGMLRARGRAVVFMDADLATPLHYLSHFYALYQQGFEVVVGTRNLRTHHKNVLRWLVANAGNLLFRVAGGIWIEDSQCGFKMFSAHAAKICFSRLTIQKWGFDMEVLAIAKTHHLKMASQRINDWQHMAGGTFDEAVLKNAVQSLRDLLHIARRRWTRTYLRPGAFSALDETES